MHEINILVLSVGRRVELIERFKKAKVKMGVKGKIIGSELSKTAPAIYQTDSFHIIERVGTTNYINQIIEICNKENISLIVPTIDTELLCLSENKELIESKTKAKVLISSNEVIKICRNKINTTKFFELHGFGTPKYIEYKNANENTEFPLFIKPLDGSSSVNAFKINNVEELDFFVKYIKNPIIQEFAVGEEYSVDVFCDFNSKPITIVPRLRIAVRGGEIAKGKIVKDREIIEDVQKMLTILKPLGHITIQCIKTNKGIEYIEINPRFGGGAPMSIDSGADSCVNLYKLLQGEQLQYNEDYKDNLLFLRFDSSIMLDENMEIIND